MFKVALINMPFTSVRIPSIALTQLRSVLTSSMAQKVESEIYYLNHDFSEYFGREFHEQLSNSTGATVSGVGDWLFRQVAFPDLDDNAAAFLQRYSRQFGASHRALLHTVQESRHGLDAFLDRLIDQYELHRCDLAGFTSMFAQNVASFAMARKLKQCNANIVTVMGGANCESSMGAVIARNVPAIDFVFSGPSLRTFPHLVEKLLAGEIEKCHQIKGVVSKRKLDAASNGDFSEIGEELDIETDVPLDYEGFLCSLDRTCPGTAPALLFETSRGCWWGERSHCTFCGLNGMTKSYRSMSPDKALAQFDELFGYSPRVTTFKSVDNIMPANYVKTVFPYVKPPRNASIFYEVKADLRERDIERLAQAGVTQIQPGIEALATSTLKLMKKGTTSFQNLRFLGHCGAYGIHPSWNLLIGFPGEEGAVYEKYVEDLPWLVHLLPPAGVYPVRFDRFSPYFTMAAEYGLNLKPYDFYAMVYPFSEQELEAFAYFFADHNHDNPYMDSTAKWLKKLEVGVEHWNTRWHERDGKLEPRLTIESRGASKVVCDTRSGESIEHELEPTALRVLETLRQPMTLPSLAREVSGVTEAALERHVQSLRELGLVFHEDVRFASLVVETAREQGHI